MERILISRTDSIGDVVLTLPMAGLLKSIFPDCEVHFLGSSYTKDIVLRSENVDYFHDWLKLQSNPTALTKIGLDAILHVFPNKKVATMAKNAGIPTRVGTSHRLFHWWTCNKLVNFSRKNSSLLEAQLNAKLLEPFGYTEVPSAGQLLQYIGWKNDDISSEFIPKNEKFNLIFHMKSKGSAFEWPLNRYLELAKTLESKTNIILTGTEEEGEEIRKTIPEIFDLTHVHSTLGKLTVKQLVSLIGLSDGLLACSTGPLHIAGVSGIHALGLYPNIRPMDAGRWGPLGTKAEYMEGAVSGKELNVDIDEVRQTILGWV